MALKDPASSLYKLVDGAVSPDPYYTKDYEVEHRGKGTPLIIDNGSCTCKAGWAGEDKPRLVFRNATAKTRGKKGEADCVAVGNDITHVEAMRSTMKSQFDRNVVVNFSYQEQVLDYTFAHLGLGGVDQCIPHPVVMTEPVCNPVCSRSQMSELLFECYGVPSVAYGIDALFSAHHNIGVEEGMDALIVSSGHQTTCVLPVLDGMLDSTHCKRINLGGMQTVGYLQRLLQLKYPDLQTQITLSCAQQILHHHSYLALDYREELKAWATGPKECRTIQLPFNQSAVGSAVTDASREAKDKLRREKARKQLLKLNKQKREDKIASLLRQLSKHITLRAQQESCDFEEFQLMLDEAGHESEESLACAIQQLESQLEAEQEKLATLVRNLADVGRQKQVSEEVVSEEWLQSLKERRKELLEFKRQRDVKRVELGKRRSAASQNRMRIISSLGAEVAVKKGKQQGGEDTFGMDDSDWNVYRTIDKHAEDSDSEKEEMELGEIVKVLEKHDPSYVRGSSFLSSSSSVDMATCYQLVLGVERFRVPEITFQPPMVGVDQSGLSETLEFVLQYYPPEVQQRLVQHVFVTGGNTLHHNFSQRLTTDLRCMRPFQSSFGMHAAQDPVLDAWRGGAKWAPLNHNLFITKQDYMEQGSEFMRRHSMANTPLV